MPPTLVAGNWKMNTTLADAAALARDVRPGVDGISGVTTVVCPPAVAIVPVSMALEGSSVLVGAQDVNPNPPGAHNNFSIDKPVHVVQLIVRHDADRPATRGVRTSFRRRCQSMHRSAFCSAVLWAQSSKVPPE